MNIYCGNNSLNRDLTSGVKRRGTRYECFRKGVGVGLNTPLTGDEDIEYEPIYEEGLFCGNGNTKPRGYKKLGQPFQCLRKGIGVGKRLQLDDDRHDFSFTDTVDTILSPILVCILVFIVILVVLLLVKPKFIYKKDKINYWKLILVPFVISVAISLLYLIITKNYMLNK